MKATSIWKVLGEGLELLAELLAHKTPEALKAAEGLVSSLLSAHGGAVTPADVEKALETLRAHLADNDAAALEQLAARFPKATP